MQRTESPGNKICHAGRLRKRRRSDDRIEGNPSSRGGSCLTLARSLARPDDEKDEKGAAQGSRGGRRWKTWTAETWAWHLRGMTAHPSRVLTRPWRMGPSPRLEVARAKRPPCNLPPGKFVVIFRREACALPVVAGLILRRLAIRTNRRRVDNDT